MNKKEQLKKLIELLRIKSVSTDPKYRDEMKKALTYLDNLLINLGFKTKVLKGQINDVLFAEKIIKRKLPTIMFYGHYDVQPPEPLDKWLTKPFEPVVKKGHIFARGADDDKGQLMTSILAVEQLIKEGNLNLNIKFIIEGEEELGSISIPSIAKKYSNNLLKCDYLVASDSEMLSKGNPSLDVSLRGIVYTEIILETGKSDVHSGVYGGVAENPAIILAQIISKLKDEKGNVLIPGFYKDVLPKSKLPKTDKVKITKEKIINDGKFFLLGGGERNLGLKERMWYRPTLDVNGIKSGFIGEGQKTIIPCTASAKVSMRLVANQDPKKIYLLFQRYIKKLVPKNIKLTIINHAGSYPYLAPTDNEVYKLMSQSLNEVFKKEPVYMGVGGSIGFVPIMAKALKVPCILVGFGLPTDNLHAPNENFYLNNFYGGIDTIYRFIKKVEKK